MSTIAENLQLLKNDHTAIKEALVEKGVEVGTEDGFNDFATLISNIPEGWEGQFFEKTVTELTNSFTVPGIEVIPKMSIVTQNEYTYEELLEVIQADTTDTKRIVATSVQFSVQFGGVSLNTTVGAIRKNGVPSIGHISIPNGLSIDSDNNLVVGYPEDKKQGSMTMGTRYVPATYRIWVVGEKLKE